MDTSDSSRDSQKSQNGCGSSSRSRRVDSYEPFATWARSIASREASDRLACSSQQNHHRYLCRRRVETPLNLQRNPRSRSLLAPV